MLAKKGDSEGSPRPTWALLSGILALSSSRRTLFWRVDLWGRSIEAIFGIVLVRISIVLGKRLWVGEARTIESIWNIWHISASPLIRIPWTH